MTRAALTDRIVGYTTVRCLKFSYDPGSATSDLLLRLEKPESAQIVDLVLKGVAQLSIKEFGGGLTQVLYILVEDIRDLQIDRISYHVKDVERGMFECDCQDIEISEKAEKTEYSSESRI